ncbi:MAG: FAD-dependent oxidoreductase, partial [Bacillota bacterium]|nr:FAD-dependent oxidoreductase [Bacillota bacterium]
MIHTEIAIIGGGPAGMCAAISAAGQGAQVILLDREERLGGQLIKQTHRFFGSEREYAGTRGIDITGILEKEISDSANIDVRNNTTVLAIYDDGVISFEEDGVYKKLSAKSVIIATGASEKMLPFVNNDLPGVYGAGAVQTLMNQYGVIPGEKVLMVGAGNIGLIVSYQLMQAGVKVAAIIDAQTRIGGYLVHAAKVRRLGVPILTSHTIDRAIGQRSVEGAVIYELDQNRCRVPGSEKELDVDVICLAVGLSPQVELLRHVNCHIKYVPQLGGYVPVKDANLETTTSR